LVGKTQYEIQAEVDRRLAAEKARWQEEATRPLKEQLDQTQQQVQQQSQLAAQAFNTDLHNEVTALGFADIAQLTPILHNEMIYRYRQVGPGSPLR